HRTVMPATPLGAARDRAARTILRMNLGFLGRPVGLAGDLWSSRGRRTSSVPGRSGPGWACDADTPLPTPRPVAPHRPRDAPRGAGEFRCDRPARALQSGPFLAIRYPTGGGPPLALHGVDQPVGPPAQGRRRRRRPGDLGALFRAARPAGPPQAPGHGTGRR